MLDNLKSKLDLAPLLDVILILLFVFMMQLAIREDNLEVENQNLTAENQRLNEINEQIVEVIYKNETNIREKIDNLEAQSLEQLDLEDDFKTESLVEEIIKYSAIIDNFVQIDLSLATVDNIFMVNQDQPLTLNPDSQDDFAALVANVSDNIRAEMDVGPEEDEKYLLLLAIKDDYVSLKAYRIIKTAIRQIEEQNPEASIIFADYYTLTN